jgi:hypothetical protein
MVKDAEVVVGMMEKRGIYIRMLWLTLQSLMATVCEVKWEKPWKYFIQLFHEVWF